jgi:hypothetical protein
MEDFTPPRPKGAWKTRRTGGKRLVPKRAIDFGNVGKRKQGE